MQLTKQDVGSSFTEVVLADYERFIENYLSVEVGDGADLRLAQKCAESLLHLGDRLFLLDGGSRSGNSNPTEHRRALFKTIPNYAAISDVALAAKHHVVNRGEGLVRDENALRTFVAIDRYCDNDGPYFRFRKLVEVELPEGRAADVGELLHNVMMSLAKHMVDIGVLPGLPEVEPIAPPFVERATSGRTPVLRMIGRVGNRVNYGHKVFFYREKEGRLTPGGEGDVLGCAVDIKYEATVAPSVFPDERKK